METQPSTNCTATATADDAAVTEETRLIREARRALTFGGDGPLTTFVLVMRAMHLVEAKTATAWIAGNALAEEMKDWGLVDDVNDELANYGS